MIYTSTVLLSNLEPPGTSLRALRASRVAIVLPRKQNRHCADRVFCVCDLLYAGRVLMEPVQLYGMEQLEERR